jgi:tetratricopeptide (TPR) repeat protein
MNLEHLALLNAASDYYEKLEFDKALDCVNKVLQRDKTNILARNQKASILIESWTGEESDIGRVKEAISHLRILCDSDPRNKAVYCYNLGNAFNTMAGYQISRNKRALNESIIHNLETAKDYYQESLEINASQPHVWINKGNIFQNLGRYFEAIECYDRAILLQNDHYNAWACRGLTCWHLSQIISDEEDRGLLFHHAMIYLAIEMALHPDNQIDKNTRKLVNTYIERNKIKIDYPELVKEQMPRKISLFGERFNVLSLNEDGFQAFYYTFCQERRLFLNTHFDCSDCDLTTKDLLSVGFVASISDAKRPYELMKRWYSLLDEYKTARFFLTLSQYKHQDFAFLDKQRYEPDYSLNYIQNVETLKYAFLIMMGIYDKIAFFLNYYDELGLSDDSINFWGSNSIFNQRPIVENDNWNHNIVAMDSIRRDLEKKELRKMVDVRNYIVHRYFVLHDIVNIKDLTYPYDPNNTQIDNPDYHMDIHEFFNLTIRALRNVRDMLFSLSFYISENESKKEEELGGIIPSLDWTASFDQDPELTKIARELEGEIVGSMKQCPDDITQSLMSETEYRTHESNSR